MSDDGAVKVFQLLTSLRISDPTLDVSEIAPDVENETVVPICDVTYRHESFRNVAYDSFQEGNSKADLLSHWFDSYGGIFLVSTERLLADLIPKVDDFTKLAHSRGAQVIFRWDSKLLEFLDCLHTPISQSESAEVFAVKDFLQKFEKIFTLSSVSSILCFRNGKFRIYLMGLVLHHNFVARLFAETITDSFLSPSANMSSKWSFLKFLTSLRCWCGLSGQSCRALGAAIRDCEHLKRIVVNECDDSITDLLEHIRQPSKCSLEIGSFFIRIKEGNSQKCHLTSSGAVTFAGLISKFDNIISLCLDFSNCCSAAVDTLVAGITHNTLKQLVLHGTRLTPRVAALLGRTLPEMSSLEVLELTGLDGTILEAEAPLTNSFCYFPNLMELNLSEFDMDEHNLCGLLENLRFVPNLMELRVDGKSLGHADCCTAKVNTVGGFPLKALKELTLYEVCLTPAAATMLGQILPEMSSLQELVLSGVDGSLIKAEEMEALFGGLNKTLPLHHLTFRDFSVQGSLSPFVNSFRFLANLRVLRLGKLNMDEHNLCALLESLRFLPNLKVLRVEGGPQSDAHFCSAELNVMASVTHKTLEHLRLDGISLTPVSAALLGRSLPEISSLQSLELFGVDGSILQAKEMEALFGGFNKTLPLYRLTLRNFSSRGCLATLCKSFRFFPHLRQLSLGLSMDEQDVCSLLENLRFIRSLRALRVQSEDQRDARCYTTNTIQDKIQEKLNLVGISLTAAAAAALGRSLPEMASLQVLEITGRDRHVLQAEEMDALFGRFNKAVPLCELTFSGFSVTGCLAPLIKSLRCFPNLTKLRLERLNMDENDQCDLLKSFGLIRNMAELNTFAFDTLTPQSQVEKRLKLDEISLTPAVAEVLGQLLPKMSSLQVLQLTQMDESILQAKEMEALFGGFNETMQLFELKLSGFSVRGCLAPLFRSLRFFSKLIELNLEKLNMDEHDLNGLLESFQFIPDLQELRLSGNPLGHSVRWIVPHVINLKKLRFLWIDQTDHSEEDLIYVRDSIQQARPELEIRGGSGPSSG